MPFFVMHIAPQKFRGKIVRSLRLDFMITYGFTEITGKVSMGNAIVIQKYFSTTDTRELMRGKCVELLVGSDYTHIHIYT